MTSPVGYKRYVPDPQKYYRYFKLQSQGKLDPHVSIMRGGERSAMMSIDRALELYDPDWKKEVEKEKMTVPKINFVTETQQVVEQAKAMLKRERENSKQKNKQDGGKNAKRRKTHRGSLS